MQIIWSQISVDCSPDPFRLQSLTPMAQVGTCVACEVTNVRVATATAECACQVCEHCAELFMADGACGVCGAALSADDLEEEDDASAS